MDRITILIIHGLINVIFITGLPISSIRHNLLDSLNQSDESSGLKNSTEEIKCVLGKCAENENKHNKVIPPRPPKLTNNAVSDLTWTQSPYQTDNQAIGVNIANFNGNLFPYAHPKLFAMANPVMTIKRLPPVYVNRKTSMDRFIEDPWIHRMDSLEGLKSTRVTRDDDDDELEEFLKQLAQDTDMVNVVPTMEVPFARSPSYNTHVSPTFAVYPRGFVSDCGMPVLFSCMPKISIGVLGEEIY